MAGSGREQGPDLIQELLDNPTEFDFFQAVRLIEQYMAGTQRRDCSALIGGDSGPQNEPIRFRAYPSLSFPSGQIAGMESRLPESQRSEDGIPVDMTVSFMGLTGPNGVLPAHYTSTVIERSHQRNKDDTLREFFDLFNHRMISFYYRAWEKYRFQFRYERNLCQGEYKDDVFTRSLFSLVGLEIPGLRHRFSFDDQAIVYYGGLLAQRSRNSVGLEQILTAYFSVRAKVLQFVGHWLELPPELQSCFPSLKHRQGLNLQLGSSAVIGDRAWDLQSRFRVQFGPVNREEFDRLLPGGKRLEAVEELIRFYVGAEKEFDIQLILKKEDVPSCQLAEDEPPRLGWNTWLGTASRTTDAHDAVFQQGAS